MRLLKLGCICLETGLLGNKALSVIKLIKPYKLQVGGTRGGPRHTLTMLFNNISYSPHLGCWGAKLPLQVASDMRDVAREATRYTAHTC
jgi:hypothetical protein